MLYGVILAGGKGERLWPISRADRPKPFFAPDGQTTLLESTLSRICPLIPPERILLVTSADVVPLIRETLPEIPPENILAEPVGRNTAPAVAWSALEILSRDPDGVMAVFPSDHFIDPPETFRHLLEGAVQLIAEDRNRLVTIGIRPDSPATGYGYMKVGEPLSSDVLEDSSSRVFHVESFYEKPDRERAERYLADGRYFWNAGIFLWRADRVVELIRTYRPAIAEEVELFRRALLLSDGIEAERIYRDLESVSIDVAVLEKSGGIVLFPATFHWSDLGTFDSLAAILPGRSDDRGNRVTGAESLAVDASGNLVLWERTADVGKGKGKNGEKMTENPLSAGSGENEMVVLAGVNDLLVVRRGNLTLITKKGDDPLLRRLAERFEKDSRSPSEKDPRDE